MRWSVNKVRVLEAGLEEKKRTGKKIEVAVFEIKIAERKAN